MTSSNQAQEQLYHSLRQLPNLARLEPAELGELAALGECYFFRAGDVIFAEGQPHEQTYFVCNGTLALEMSAGSSRRRTLLTLGRGDLLAWSALLGNHLMTATAVALEDVETVGFQANELCDLMERSPQLGYRLMRIFAKGLSQRLLATRLQLLDFYQSND